MNNSQKCWYVYLLCCADGTLYCGSTTDPERRLQQHNAGTAAKYTRGRGPVQLLGTIACASQSQAVALEEHIKHLPRSKKRACF